MLIDYYVFDGMNNKNRNMDCIEIGALNRRLNELDEIDKAIVTAYIVGDDIEEIALQFNMDTVVVEEIINNSLISITTDV